MIDIQNQDDTRQVPLKMVGIKNIALPLLVPTKSGKPQNTIGFISFFTDLSHRSRGTHMSRFVEILYRNRHNHLTFQQLKHIASEAKKELKAENAYFVRTYKTNPSIAQRDCNTNLLYSAIVVGDENGFKDNIDFSIYERLIKYNKGNYGWVLTPCLEYQDGKIIDGKREFAALCDFPLFRTDLTDEEVKKLGFEVERRGGDDIYEDSFGEKHSIPTEIMYKKNGVEIRYVY